MKFIYTFSAFLLCLLVNQSSSKRIPLPPGVILEGISHVADNLFIGSNPRTGDMLVFDSVTGIVATVVRAPPRRASFGVHYDKPSKRMFVAGGGQVFVDFVNNQIPSTSPLQYPGNYTPAIHIYDLPTGNIVRSCLIPDALFLNDITMDEARKYVYVTDSILPRLLQLDLRFLPRCVIHEIPLPPAIFTGNNFFSSGVQPFRKGLLVNNFGLGGVYFVDLLRMKNGAPKVTQVIPSSVISPDGLQRVGKNGLLVVSVNTNTIFRYRLTINKKRQVKAVRTRKFTSPDFSELSAVGISNGRLVATNMNNTLFGMTGKIWIASVKI